MRTLPVEEDIFPSKPGNGVFFKPSLQVTPEAISAHRDQKFILIVYGLNKTIYHYNKEDPHAAALRELGYEPGDKLKNKYHPLV
jgi:hypothetical protein